jgi:RNA polymerase sigma factor (sigma-70 family)
VGKKRARDFEFDLVCKSMGAAITNIARYHQCSGESAEDSRQHALILLLDFLDNHDPKEQDFGVIFRVYLHRRMIDRKRKLQGRAHHSETTLTRRRNLLGSVESELAPSKRNRFERAAPKEINLVDEQDEIDAFNATLTSRWQKIVNLLIDGFNFREIGDQLGIHESRVSQLATNIKNAYAKWQDQR